jgi:predicted RNase H-like nuclease (RuvC/YqgF family)
MPWWTWIALGVFALSVVAMAIFAVYTLGRVKRLKAEAEAITAALDEVTRRAEELERRSAHASERAAEVERARARLDGSLERLSVLSWALGDARKGIARLRGAYLRK